MMMRSRTRLIILNIIGCILFLALPLLFIPGGSSRITKELFRTPTLKEILAYSLIIGYFYLNFFLLIPRFYFKKKYAAFALCTLLCFAFISAIPNIVFPGHGFGTAPPDRPAVNFDDRDFREPPPRDHSDMRPPTSPNDEPHDISLLDEATHHLFLFLGVFFFSLLLKINNRLKKTEEEKITTELSYLKAQINPHFLFNTLNSIYSLALEKSDNTATAVVKLSGMMRYVLTDADNDLVDLEKELSYIIDYTELQQIRYENAIPLQYSVKGSVIGKKIAPLILLPFVENAFKHGINAEENSSIKISVDISDNDLFLFVENNIVTTNLTEEEKTGVGINNVKNRLQLLYPATHKLEITEKENKFTVLLKITLS